jgi:hypothetical protein
MPGVPDTNHGGHAEVSKDGSTYRISGSIAGNEQNPPTDRLLPATPFEITVNCP